jgi:hypothetical protein
MVWPVAEKRDAFRGGDNPERCAAGIFHQGRDPDLKTYTDFEQQAGFPDGDEVAWFRRIGMLVLIAAQKGSHTHMRSADLFSEVLQNRNCDHDIDRFRRRGGMTQRCGEQPVAHEEYPAQMGRSEISHGRGR